MTADWSTALADLVRGVAGGSVVGIQLLYTVEVWWLGSHTPPGRALALLALGVVAVFLLSRRSGFHGAQDTSPVDAVLDTVQALALGLVAAFAVLFSLRVITLDTPPLVVVTTAMVQAVPFAIGVALADEFVDRERSGSTDRPEAGDLDAARATLTDMGATAVGAVVLAGAIAPTQEVPLLLARATPVSLLVVAALTLLLTYGLVFVAGFADERKRRSQPGVLQRPVTETVVSYLVALAAAAAMLWFFENLGVESNWYEALGRTILLGLPAAIGGALGRLVL